MINNIFLYKNQELITSTVLNSSWLKLITFQICIKSFSKSKNKLVQEYFYININININNNSFFHNINNNTSVTI